MIANKEWFVRRKYTGWGLTPRTWQGWVYILIMVAAGVLLSNLPLSVTVRISLMSLYVLFIVVDILQTMAGIKLDERETKIEAISERNASWSMVAALAIEVIYMAISQRTLIWEETMQLLIGILITGLIVKGTSNFILKDRDL